MEQNWRAGLTQDSRNKIVNRIMDTLQRHTPLAGQDGMTELWKIANRFEESIFYAASDQHDYLRKISLKMLSLETRTQNALNGSLPTSSRGTSHGPLDSGIRQAQAWQQVVPPVQAGMLNNGIQGSAGGEPASTFFSSITNIPHPAPVMNALGQVSGNLPALNGGSVSDNTIGGQAPSQNLHSQGVLPAIQQLQQARQQQLQLLYLRQEQTVLQQQSQAQVGSGDSLQQVGQPGIDEADIVWSKMQTLKDKYLQDMKDLYAMLTARSQQPMPEEQLQKLAHYKNVLQRMLPYLIASKGSLPKEFKQEKVEAFEKQIVCIMETFKRRRQVVPQPQQPQQLGNLGQFQAGQQPQQASQILQPGNKPVEQQMPQTNSPLTDPTALQSDNSSFPFLQSGVTSLQQAMGVVTQSTPLSSLANAVRMNVLEMQQDQQFHQNRSLKDQGQSKRLQLWHLQQYQQKHLQLFYVFFCMLIFTFYLLFVFCGSMTT